MSNDALVLLPKTIFFINCLRSGILPEIWKFSNVVLVNKKNEKNMKGSYLPIPLLPIFWKILENIYMILLTHTSYHKTYSAPNSFIVPIEVSINIDQT